MPDDYIFPHRTTDYLVMSTTRTPPYDSGAWTCHGRYKHDAIECAKRVHGTSYRRTTTRTPDGTIKRITLTELT